jgi:hypothetical protein
MTKQLHYFMGIDPGASGGAVIINCTGELIGLYRFDEDRPGGPAKLLADLCSTWKFEGIGLEKVHSMPGQGVSSMFTFGINYGVLQGAMTAVGVEYSLVAPQSWQKWLPWTEDQLPKARAVEAATKIWGQDRFIFPRCRTPHGGCVDAALIAMYMLRLYTGLSAATPAAPLRKKRRPMVL